MRLKEKAAIVTGGGTGIGQAICLEFARQGAKVVIAGIIEEEINETKALIEKEGFECTAVQCDVSDSVSVKKMVDHTVSKYGRIDVLVNNAAIQLYGTSETMDEDDWDKLIDINLKGPFLCTKYVIPIMKKLKKGSIIHMGSATAIAGHPGLIAYTAAKGGIHAMSRASAIEYAKEGIRVNVVAPGTVNTPILRRHLEKSTQDPEKTMDAFNKIHPIGRVANPEEVAYACVYLASDESSFVTGSTHVVDGGYTVQGILPD